MMLYRRLILIAAIVAAICSSAVFSEEMNCGKPCCTEISDIPWEPVSDPSAKVIYGDDDRIDVYQETDPERLIWAASTCALIYTSRLNQNGDGSWTITTPSAFSRFGLPACPSEPFGSQPTASYCTGFMVGSDLIVTAGHCYNASSFAGTRFIFGFWMTDAATPRLTFAQNEVYQGVEIISTSPSGEYDHTLVRVDRPITAPSAQPFMIRREGAIEQGEYLGVIGHPSGLPMKIAFGNTYVRSPGTAGYFVANLDTYGGNSGSPVINATTGILEGILVRGETDYVNMGTCFLSNVVPNDGGRGEDVTKATVFAEYVPEATNAHTASLTFDHTAYNCTDVVTVQIVDVDLIGAGEIEAFIESTSGDEETITLVEEEGRPGSFLGSIPLSNETPTPASLELEVQHGDILSAVFEDSADAEGNPFTVIATVAVDCMAPSILSIDVSYSGGTQTRIQVVSDELSRVTVLYGLSCGEFTAASSTALSDSHLLVLAGLQPDTRYYYVVQVSDAADNSVVDDNQGACYFFHTYSSLLYFTEYFSTSNPMDLSNMQLTLIPVDHPNYFQACIGTAAGLPNATGDQLLSLEDDDFVEIPLENEAAFSFYGIVYNRIFVGSNGYVTFAAGDTAYQGFAVNHFAAPRVSGLMYDLNPEIRGSIYYHQNSDRCVITYEDIPVYDSSGFYPAENTHTFQMELFFNGAIRITWLNLYTMRAIVGVSAGMGIANDYVSMNLSNLNGCDELHFDGDYHSADINQNWQISMSELLRVVQFYNVGGYGCDPASDDGYDPEGDLYDCTPHDSDYAPADWRIKLSELLRIVQLYNAGGYCPDNDGEDGFRPLP